MIAMAMSEVASRAAGYSVSLAPLRGPRSAAAVSAHMASVRESRSSWNARPGVERRTEAESLRSVTSTVPESAWTIAACCSCSTNSIASTSSPPQAERVWLLDQLTDFAALDLRGREPEIGQRLKDRTREPRIRALEDFERRQIGEAHGVHGKLGEHLAADTGGHERRGIYRRRAVW